MGHRKRSAPRRGSLGFRPRKRAVNIIPRVRSWPTVLEIEPKPLGYIGYKVGMTHVYMIDDRPESPTEGKEIFVPATVIETPPMLLAGIRLYGFDPNKGLYSLTEKWAEKKILFEHGAHRLIKNMLSGKNGSQGKDIEKMASKARDIRVLLLSQPRLAGGVPKKTPELLETPLAGSDINKKLVYASEKLGKEVKINMVFNLGLFIDVIGVTRGKGFQGPIKRFGAKKLPRWHKHRKGSRTVASRGSRIGALSSTPQAGQMGFHQRVDYNKRILMIGDASANEKILEEINPLGGWHKYGLVKNDFLMLTGSVPGVRRRPLILRQPVRKAPWQVKSAPKIKYVYMPGQL